MSYTYLAAKRGKMAFGGHTKIDLLTLVGWIQCAWQNTFTSFKVWNEFSAWNIGRAVHSSLTILCKNMLKTFLWHSVLKENLHMKCNKTYFIFKMKWHFLAFRLEFNFIAHSVSVWIVKFWVNKHSVSISGKVLQKLERFWHFEKCQLIYF